MRLLWLALILASPSWAASGPPFECAPGCTDRGNCNQDDGDCICPYGYTGKACEVDALSACRITPDGPAICHTRITMSCECLRQCEKYHCKGGVCGRPLPPPNRGCYMRDGVPPEKQTSKAPEEDELGVRYFAGWHPGAPEVKGSEEVLAVLRHEDRQTVPPSKCPAACNDRGFCWRNWEDPQARPGCLCHRGFEGGACEVEDDKWCLSNCGGHGKCSDYHCQCKPPYFSLGCSRNTSVPHSAMHPSPANFKIYMYEINSQYSYPIYMELGEPRAEIGTGMYSFDLKFIEQFGSSPVRTYDPTEASLFFVPSFSYQWTGPPGDGNEYLNLLLGHVREKWPYWNRTGGRDHFVITTADRSGCHLKGLAQQAIKLIHFGYYLPDPKASNLATVREQSTSVGYSCYHPQRDVVTVPLELRVWDYGWAARSNKQTVDEIIKGKTKLLFFFGGTHVDAKVPEFSGDSRQQMDRLDQAWKDPDIEYITKERAPFPDMQEYGDKGIEDYYRHNKFCFIPYGWGWGNRLGQAVVCNCVPVIVQERVFQPYEDVLPYETFSVRLTNADLPRIREVLRGITELQYRGMMEQLVRYRSAFHWFPEADGRAFDYTIASLRRRYMNKIALYY